MSFSQVKKLATAALWLGLSISVVGGLSSLLVNGSLVLQFIFFSGLLLTCVSLCIMILQNIAEKMQARKGSLIALSYAVSIVLAGLIVSFAILEYFLYKFLLTDWF